jgi:hypothetical protein
MDERLEKALEFANYMQTLSNQRRVLQEQFKESLVYFYNGSQFTIDTTLINYVNWLVEKGNTENVVFVDDNEIPVEVVDLTAFLEDIQDQYFSALNSYHTAYTKLKSNRSVEKLIDYE